MKNYAVTYIIKANRMEYAEFKLVEAKNAAEAKAIVKAEVMKQTGRHTFSLEAAQYDKAEEERLSPWWERSINANAKWYDKMLESTRLTDEYKAKLVKERVGDIAKQIADAEAEGLTVTKTAKGYIVRK